ncbi:MAG: PilZ domain-containing protein [Candidatus Omnitrophica bacterium]|nr:PilZ domain-containing protein [Candidatus Omnitrophota bacterium]MBU4473451.1 PilZ domain-containing protein [Candidatus Omnitrophota bacterium]MCG2706214.1 PilZ domain-containing protein [Candidatus Omnitrophota bacterium]
MDTNFQEKRSSPRVKLQRPLRYQLRGLPEFNNVIGDNISTGGIGFFSDKFIAPNTLTMLEINILSRMLRAVGKIVRSVYLSHSNKYYLGIEFLELDPIEQMYLGDFINMQRTRF